ncbi:MAG: hypothetical protein WCX30_03385 [Candidatus Paceibacterota bacterium]|jgi:hypothetical protein|nr:hypothetical protein [bacterium]
MSYENFSLAEENEEGVNSSVDSFETQRNLLENFRSSLFKGDIFNALLVKEELEKDSLFDLKLLKDNDIETATIAGFETCLSKGDFSSVAIIKATFPEYEQILKNKIIEESQLFLEEKDFDKLLEMQKASFLDDNIFKDRHFKELLNEKFNQFLEEKDFDKLLEMQKASFLSEEMLDNDKFKKLIDNEFDSTLQSIGDIKIAKEDIVKVVDIRKNFSMQEKSFNEITEKLVKNWLQEKNLKNLLQIKENNLFDFKTMDEEDDKILNELIKTEFSQCLSEEINITKAQRIKNNFEESEKIIEEIILEQIKKCVSDKDINRLAIIKAGLGVDLNKVNILGINDFIKKEFQISKMEGDIVKTELIKESFPENKLS